jgi:ABC-type transport system involved in Fe-S cluster assembly fused permease/ATPase subunit
MFFVIIIGTFILEPLFGIAVFVILPIVMFLQYLQMTVEWESFIKNKSAEKTESEIMLGDSINNFKTVQSFGHEDMIVGHYQDLLEPARASGLRTALCNATIVGFSNFFLTAQ